MFSGLFKSTDVEEVYVRSEVRQVYSVPLYDCVLGSLVDLGCCKQDDENFLVSLQWRVVKREEDVATVVCRRALQARPFASGQDTAWSTSSLRAWLNGEFLQTIFNDQERAMIIDTEVVTAPNPYFSSKKNGEADKSLPAVSDKVFVLSLEEASRWLHNDDGRKCAPLEVDVVQGKSPKAINKMTSWWLRTPGMQDGLVCFVDNVGSISSVGVEAGSQEICVRPALRLHLPPKPVEGKK